MPDPISQEVIDAILADKKKTRRWKNIRTFSWIFVFLLALLLIFTPSKPKTDGDSDSGIGKPYVALVRMSGLIMPNTSFSARKMLPVLQKAFSDKKAKGVVIEINSPGGSPVQATIIHNKIMELKNKYHKKVVVLADDALASGAYLVAVSADKIYVHNDTLTGSIGVIMEGFGFTGLMDKVGVSRRAIFAGDNKDRLDPFLPLKPEDVAKAKSVLDQAHQHFIQLVLNGRKGKLNGDPRELFSGDFWTGSQAVKLGLADGVAEMWEMLPKEFNVDHVKVYKAKVSVFDAVFRGIDAKLNLGFTNQSPKLNASL
jgi:protease-4